MGEVPERRGPFEVASLNGKVYIIGGLRSLILYNK